MTDIVPANQPAALAERTAYTERIVQTARETIARDLTDDQFMLFAELIRSTGLNPFQNQLHAVVRRDRRTGSSRVVFQVGIDGLRLIAARTGEFQGEAGPQWAGPDGKWNDIWVLPEPPAAARVGVWRKGFREPIWGIAHYNEFAQRLSDGTPTAMWQSMPANMLAKCAEAQALRKAFPAETSGLYVPEEGGAMQHVERAQEERAAAAPPPRRQQQEQPAPAPAKRSGPAAFSPDTQRAMRDIIAYAKANGFPPAVYEDLIGSAPTQTSLARWIESTDDPVQAARQYIDALIKAEEEPDAEQGDADDVDDIDEADAL